MKRTTLPTNQAGKSSGSKEKHEIYADIRKITKALENADPDEMRDLHRYLDGKYQASIDGWGKSMYGYIDGVGFDLDAIGPDSIKDNLLMMKPKLEAFANGWNAKGKPYVLPGQSGVNVTVNNTVNIAISFQEARKQVEDMSSLTNEQTKEVLQRIDEIEKIIKGNGNKKSKWEQIKPVLVWIADKSYDLGKIILPLLLKIDQ